MNATASALTVYAVLLSNISYLLYLMRRADDHTEVYHQYAGVDVPG